MVAQAVEDQPAAESKLTVAVERAVDYATIALRVEQKVEEVNQAEWLYFLEREI